MNLSETFHLHFGVNKDAQEHKINNRNNKTNMTESIGSLLKQVFLSTNDFSLIILIFLISVIMSKTLIAR